MPFWSSPVASSVAAPIVNVFITNDVVIAARISAKIYGHVSVALDCQKLSNFDRADRVLSAVYFIRESMG